MIHSIHLFNLSIKLQFIYLPRILLQYAYRHIVGHLYDGHKRTQTFAALYKISNILQF